ncbi:MULTISPECIES: methylenetetrahydrofolate reductase C-terminal domain-containing protein [Acinetobacter]|uniref:methylenetetrahydrofolate reductase C-terminal domain-containing protein n=1 Tax=Acinetobacter TaxID=469 RepID=UPI00157BF524|nr:MULTISPECIES: methylenetetrahydrofolate reductase C-terminal domain-containing protein [unclassified Acinetobacter]MDM1782011.1 methylenetetrahydrofolate reductase C-terminal domain-containing protein [Acinetobacter indicus]QKQ69416.1 methylenetetrahydrofolate reductase [Acinetobacter sp. 10FS3-1]WPC35514.1 methylenetetrahydrofolate reductase C-terminal domain-containing protein [Acinetobacter sp. YWS30-1]
MLNFSQYLSKNQFCILLEYLTTSQDTAVPQSLAGYPVVTTLADRVHADDDLAPLEVAKSFPSHIEKLLHYSGKGRDIQDFEMFLQRAQKANIQNLLLLTGDKLKNHSDGCDGSSRTRYLESVNAVMVANKHGGFHIGVAFNPFKYAEAERDAQYLKLHKKLKAGAGFIITQLGYDIDALKQAKAFLKHHHYPQKMLVCVMPLSFARANFMLKNKVAGIVITPHMLQVLSEEKQAGLQENAYKRCALQILICKQLGFAGVHLSACHKPEEQILLESYIEQYQHLDLEALEDIWNSLWQVKTGKEFVPELPYYSRQPTSTQLIKYQHLHFMHETLFESKIAKGIGGFIFKASFWENKSVAKALLQTEFISKHGVVGCESCGQCRLADTLYICPETCPKGLANGPCGGTCLDRCEFGDRECIHSVKARLAKAIGQTELLKQQLIPTVPIEVRGTSSWKNWYLATEA